MNIDERTARKFLQLKQSADSRGIEFDLTLTGVRNLLNAKRCKYTGVKLTHETNNPRQLTVDRVDNTKGYVTGNVVACARSFNLRKGELTLDDLAAIQKVVNSA